MHRASTMFYLHYKAVLNLHGIYVLLHFNEITRCYCFGTHTQINGMPRGSCRVLRRSAASFYSLLIVPRCKREMGILNGNHYLSSSPIEPSLKTNVLGPGIEPAKTNVDIVPISSLLR